MAVCYATFFVVLGFTVAELSVTPDNASDTVTVDLVVEKLVGSFFSIPITVNSVDFSRAAACKKPQKFHCVIIF